MRDDKLSVVRGGKVLIHTVGNRRVTGSRWFMIKTREGGVERAGRWPFVIEKERWKMEMLEDVSIGRGVRIWYADMV